MPAQAPQVVNCKDGLQYLHIHRIEKTAWRISRWKPIFEFDDLRQEGLVAVMEWIVENGPIDEALAYTVSRNRMVTYARSLMLRRQKVVPDSRMLTRLTGRQFDIAMRLDLEYAMGSLKPRHRKLVELTALEGMSYAEAGMQTGYSDRGAGSTLARVRKSLQGGLGPSYGEWSRKHAKKYAMPAKNDLRARKAGCIAVDQNAAAYIALELDTRSRRERRRDSAA